MNNTPLEKHVFTNEQYTQIDQCVQNNDIETINKLITNIAEFRCVIARLLSRKTPNLKFISKIVDQQQQTEEIKNMIDQIVQDSSTTNLEGHILKNMAKIPKYANMIIDSATNTKNTKRGENVFQHILQDYAKNHNFYAARIFLQAIIKKQVQSHEQANTIQNLIKIIIAQNNKIKQLAINVLKQNAMLNNITKKNKKHHNTKQLTRYRTFYSE